MAGMDAYFRYAAADETVVVACLTAARRRARTLGLRGFRSGVHTDVQVAYLEIHGQTYALDIYLERLRRDLPTIAEATASRRTLSSRRALALGITEILTRYRLMMYDRYGEDWIPTLRARRTPAYMLPHQLWSGDVALQDRLAVTSELMASWHFGEVAPPVLLEELHTAAELILEALVNRRAKKLSFAQLVDLALAGCVFSPYPGDQALTLRLREGAESTSVELAARDLLLSLKDVRKEVRHRGATGAKEWLDSNFWEAAALLERMSFQTRSSTAETRF